MRIIALRLAALLAASVCTAQSCTGEPDGKEPEAGPTQTLPPGTWASKLYPLNWTPGFADDAGRFVHDFSYAGYHSGLRDLPRVTSNVADVTKAPYNADNTGATDVRMILQKAIDDLSASGGGVVYLPAGTYRINSDTKTASLTVAASNIVIRGAGPDKTFIKNASTNMRYKDIIRFQAPDGSWLTPAAGETKLSRDLTLPATTIPVVGTAGFAVGDRVILKFDLTDAFCDELGAGGGLWSNVSHSPHFLREVTAVNAAANTIEVDAPTRFPMKVRDNARMYKVRPQIEECGIEDLSIGNVRNPTADSSNESNYTTPGTGNYEVHSANAIRFRNAYNCWVRNVRTYRPAENTLDFHILSNGVYLFESRLVTVKDCDFRKPQYEGGGGNGCMYKIAANDCLIVDSHAEHGRHNFSIFMMIASGNVFLHCTSKDGYKSSDFHQNLSVANLIDGYTMDNDCLEASFRPYGTAGESHLQTTSETVIWNAKGIRPHERGYLVWSRQYGYGYVIGTSGTPNSVVTTPVSGTEKGYTFTTAPEDWVEGVGQGATLYPQSLYLDQLAKRKKRMAQ